MVVDDRHVPRIQMGVRPTHISRSYFLDARHGRSGWFSSRCQKLVHLSPTVLPTTRAASKDTMFQHRQLCKSTQGRLTQIPGLVRRTNCTPKAARNKHQRISQSGSRTNTPKVSGKHRKHRKRMNPHKNGNGLTNDRKKTGCETMTTTPVYPFTPSSLPC